MLLRRFTQHIRGQNWFAVGLDVLVVIVGIFVGLQVTDWQDEGNKRVEERVYLERLQKDVSMTIKLLSSELETGTTAVEQTFFSIKTLFEKELADKDAERFHLGLASVREWPEIRIIDNTLREMQSTGKLELIKSRQIKVAIGEFEEIYRHAIKENQRTEQVLIPKFNQVHQHVTYEPSPWAEVPLYTFEELLTTDFFYSNLYSINGARKRFLQRINRTLNAAQSFKSKLDEELDTL